MNDIKEPQKLNAKQYIPRASNYSIKKVKAKALHQKEKNIKKHLAKAHHKVKTKKQLQNDIIPIKKTKKLYIGGASSLGNFYKSIGQSVSNPNKQSTLTTSPIPSLKLDDSDILERNKKVGFGNFANAKKNEFKRMFFKKETLDGQMVYLEYLYYLLMGFWQRVYSHIRPSDPGIKSKVYKNLIGILQSNTSAFNLHSANGIQVADYSTLSVGTNKETYYDIVYSLSMMRRNTRENFLAKCDKEFIRFMKGLLKTGAKELKAGIQKLFKASKAIVQVATFVKTKTGITNFKDLYNEVFNANATLPQAQIATKKHENKIGFICALFRFRRDQLQYNYHLDKFIVRLKRLFNTPEASQILNGNHELLYGMGDVSRASQYSINAITMNMELTNLAKFKSTEVLKKGNSGITTDDVTKELRSKLDAIASKLSMGNIHKLYTVIGGNKRIFYEYKSEGNKQISVIKPFFQDQSPGQKTPKLRIDAKYIALTYRVYHMLYHLYPNIARVMKLQDEWLKIYGLPKFDELSYHRKKFKALRSKKEYESDYYRYTQSLSTVSGAMTQDISQLLNVIDNVLMNETQISTNQNAMFYRNVIHYLEGMVLNFDKSPPQDQRQIIKTVVDGLNKTATTAIPAAFNAPNDLSFVTNDKIPGIDSILESLKRTGESSIFKQFINFLKRHYQNLLRGATGMTRPVTNTKEAEQQLYKALGIEYSTALIKGGAQQSNSPVEWDGTDAHLDIIAYNEQQNLSDTASSTQTGGALTVNTDNNLSYFKFSKTELKKYYKYVVDFVNSPHFISSGSKLDKLLYTASIFGSDKGEDKAVGEESIFMELNYFSYLIKFEMGVLNFDDNSCKE